MSKITPDSIVERHFKFPKATKELIESYAFAEYKKAISDLFRYGKEVQVENTDVAMIVLKKSDLKHWKELMDSHWYLNKENYK
tara:strand:+ start:666 stop:914 length:249 start_codon:yes stop_codon:yes gene_type:complete